MKRTGTTWLFFILAFLLYAPASALAQTTTAGITGSVVDEGGEPLPGATVLAVHEPTGTQYGTSARADGSYTIRGMRPGGPYTVTASFVGYQSIQEEDHTLELGQQATINFELAEATAELDELQVIARRDRVIDRERTGARTNISEEEIDRLPTIDRSLGDFARLTPQSGGDNSMMGRSGRYNNITIDGATLNDVFGLGEAVPGSQAGAQPISLDAIQEFNVDIAPFDVRQSGFTGGSINAVTKSGTNEFRGSFRALGRNQSLVGTLGQDGSVGEFGEYYYVGTVGGPIIQDELFFFATGELVREGVPRDAFVNPTADGPNVFREDPALFNQIQDIAQNVYGYDPGAFDPITERTDNNKFLAKLDWNMSPRHRLTLRHNYVGAENNRGMSRGSSSFDFSSQMYIFRHSQHSSVAELTSNLGNDLFNEARIVYTRIRDQRDIGDNAFPSVSLQLEGGRSIGLGVEQFSHANRLDQDLIEITNNLTYQVGDHTLTFGTNNQIFRFTNLFIRNFFGAYEFSGFERDGVEYSAIEAFEMGQPTSYELSYATEAAGTDRPEAQFTAYQLGLYAQNEWQVSDQLRVTAGLRVDVPILPDSPLENPLTEQAFGYSTAATASGNPLWSPRLGFNFSTDAELNTQIRGGTGLFTGPPPFVWISNQYSNTGVDVGRVNVSFDPEEDFDPGQQFFSPDPFNQPRPGDHPALQPVETTEVNLIDEDFRYPQTWRTNIAIDQELPEGFIATLEGLFSRSINEIDYRNVNIEQIGQSAYGRPYYGQPGTFASPDRVDENFTDALLLTNTNEGYEYSLTGQIQRRQAEGVSGSLSYTYTRAENLRGGTSSQAVSNWRFTPSVDINDVGLATADFETRHRLLANVTYRHTFGPRFATSIGLVYEGRSGRPFSWIYFGDPGGDGTRNDLVYVPESEDDVFLVSDNWGLLDAFIRGRPELEAARGSIVDRNTGRDPWVNLVDLRITQEIATFEGQRFEIMANLLNVLNFLNEDWGRIRTTSFGEMTAWDFNGYVTEDDIGTEIAGREVTPEDVGKDIISASDNFLLAPALADDLHGTSFNSRWRLQLGVRYTF